MTTQEFNEKYKARNIEVRTLTTADEYDHFRSHFTLGFDFRVSPTDDNNNHLASFLSGIACNEKLITTKTICLYQDGMPSGLSTLVVEPKSSFTQTKGMKRETNNSHMICLLTDALTEIPDFALIRGWRVIRAELKGLGIGYDLRELITTEIMDVESKYPQYSFGFWGMVQSALNEGEKKVISKVVGSLSPGQLVPDDNLAIDRRLIGLPNINSIPALIGYIKDGFHYKPGFTFPNSHGPFFVKNNIITKA